jgi:chromate transporter
VNDGQTPIADRSPHAALNRIRLRELAALFLKLGTISFGGPAAHIALMETEVVRKRQWLTRQQFLDLLGAANLIPGPTSTEMAINVGFVRAGWMGLCVAGASFILPAALITAGFAWKTYVRFGALTQAVSVLTGIKAAVIAVIAIAIWRLGKTAVKSVDLAVLAGLALVAFFLGLNPIAILFGGGLLGMLLRQAADLRTPGIPLLTFSHCGEAFLRILQARCLLVSYACSLLWPSLRGQPQSLVHPCTELACSF